LHRVFLFICSNNLGYNIVYIFKKECFMFYQRHIFFCTNTKKDGGGCSTYASVDAFMFAKNLLQEKSLWGEGKLRASKSGCLGRCDSGPVAVVYPDNIWYSYVDLDDVREIIESHVINGNTVKRLQLKSSY
jgi:(2Fe-2S) ferredoxin